MLTPTHGSHDFHWLLARLIVLSSLVVGCAGVNPAGPDGDAGHPPPSAAVTQPRSEAAVRGVPVLEPQTPAVHALLIFGKRTIFLSHLPMFMSPHDFQILLVAEFTGAGGAAAKATYVRDVEDTGEPTYTVAPQSFAMDDLSDALRSGETFDLHADVFRGHFERGGTPILEGVDLSITRALFFRRLHPDDVHPKEARYLLFGGGMEWFLAHEISGQPDFDQIASVSEAPSWTNVDYAREVRVSALAGDRKLAEGQTLSVEDLADGTSSSTTVEKQLYLEYGDLK